MGADASNQNNEYEYNPEDAGDGDDDDDYDPSSFNFGNDATEQQDTAMTEAETAPTATETAPAEQLSKPKTVGGFIVEESDEEDEEDSAAAPAPSQLNGTEGAQSGLGAAAVSNAAQDVSLASEPTQDSAAAQNAQAQAQASLNGSTATTPAPAMSNDVASTSAFTAPAASLPLAQGKTEVISPAAAGTHGTTSVSATPKPSINGVTAPPDNNAVPPTPTTQRLPHDKVGRLEDRIKEDPKADTQAWLELIQHYRDKEQITNVRKVYERALEVFPTAVRLPPTPSSAFPVHTLLQASSSIRTFAITY